MRAPLRPAALERWYYGEIEPPREHLEECGGAHGFGKKFVEAGVPARLDPGETRSRIP
ncbi:hypothetical protein [Polyangium aurulentum]|uniref:hypothetical protein n=1 Tax=Polyangium aurulentum TaxID=2567896 RepID=UPI00146B2CE0|nr:hypothetical protein [Polyangium aurulentum]UQA58552.1 hypothetical protein E8A73_046170 [Polyangium aurulentum]